MRVIVEVRDADTGALIFAGAPVFDSDHVQLFARQGQPTRLSCAVPDLSAGLEEMPDTDT